ncbi:MAG: response regulator transcription factor [Acidimicrobiales bacterium]|nr:response regulator transcription factor [Acidimicrobiales bacterium]
MALRYAGYDVVTANDGGAALAAMDTATPDVIVLDVMMPVIDGLSVCRTLRQRGVRTPILVLTARHEISDRVAGLDAGADDYLTKPFALDELLARLRALLRRTSPAANNDRLVVHDLSLDPETRIVERAGRRLDLTKTEFDLLELLMHNAGVVLTREVIYDRIWGYDFETSSRSLDVYISYLRRKTEEAGEPRLIQTVRGVGFTLRVEPGHSGNPEGTGVGTPR